MGGRAPAGCSALERHDATTGPRLSSTRWSSGSGSTPRALLARYLEREPLRIDLLVHPYRAAFPAASARELVQLLSTWSENSAHWIGLDVAPHFDGHALIAAVAGVTTDLPDAFIAEGLARIARAGDPRPEG